jgi:small-conductance mechanosensitive channel
VGDYPVQFGVEYPDRPLNRLTTAFRIFTVIPILIVLLALGQEWTTWGARDYAVGGSVSVLFAPVLLMLLFRQKYPRWWYDWNLELMRFSNRVYVYLSLMDDRYPSTDEHQSVRLDFAYPGSPANVNRWLPLVKWLLAIPHYIVLLFLSLASIVVIVVAWFAILFTGRYPRGMFEFVEGVMRWGNRVGAYAFLLVTDQYPPFRLSP